MLNLSKLSSLAALSQSSHGFRAFSFRSLSLESDEQIIKLILEQRTTSKALETFRWISNLPKFSHSQSTYRALFSRLCAFRRFDIVYQLLDEMPESIGEVPDDTIFITIIKGHGRARMDKQVVDVLNVLSKFGKTPSLSILNSILDVLVKVDIDMAREFYRRKMKECGTIGDDYTCGILMKGLCLTNKIGDGFKLLQGWKSAGLEPNAVVYNTLISALCKNGKVGKACSLLNDMKNPSDVTFNTLISAYCKDDNLVQALVMLDRSFSSGCVPDAIAMTKLLEIVCRAGRVNDAVDMLNRFEIKGGKVDVVAYNTLMEGYCMIGDVKSGCALLKEMERKGHLPNVHTYHILIKGVCALEMFDLALDLVADMKNIGISCSLATYEVLIRALFSGGRMEDGFRMLESMEEIKGGSRGRISPYNSVLYGFYKHEQRAKAIQFLQSMERLFPKAVRASRRIQNLCEREAIEDAMNVYHQMVEEGGSPNVIIYDCLINRLCIEGRVREALELTSEMVERGFHPVAATLNKIINEFRRQGMGNKAVWFLEDTVRGGCVPDVRSYGPLICHLCNMGNLVKAIALLLQMVERNVTPDEMIWSWLLRGLIRESMWSSSKGVVLLNELVSLTAVQQT